ncbi:MAG: DNA polymerase II large subunit [Thaumarchaeota archaeon]|nr:DNA polymerase II large subunit [Nitrososphaerota archaeon]
MPFEASSAWEHSKKLTVFPSDLEPYYTDILTQYEDAYNIAEEAKSRGLDPNEYVESKTVFDLADRVNEMLGLTQFEGLAERLRHLLHTTTKERATLAIAEEIALGKFGMMNTDQALQYAVRAGLAVITDGVTVAPVQGISTVTIKKNDDNSEYASISYAGPMRSAGGTEAAFSVLIADVVAKKLGLSPYRAREEEIARYIEELRVYEREVGNFQYQVSDFDLRTAISNLPVEIDGVETDPFEVVVHRNLKRVATDRVRGGALRVLNDGIIGRAHKLARMLKDLQLTGWDWLAELKGGKQQSSSETDKAGAHFEEIISGRPVISSPNTRGGLRIRYGRAMNTGLSTVGIHPAIPALLDNCVVVGTQVKVDLPGKAATIAFVDSIEGPTVLLKDGSVRRVSSISQAEQLHDSLERIIDMGDALISYGDFLENNKPIGPSPYVVEWWLQDLLKVATLENDIAKGNRGIDDSRLQAIMSGDLPTGLEAIDISREFAIPLHPSYTPRFDRLTPAELMELRSLSAKSGRDVIVQITSHHVEGMLQHLLIPYTRHKESVYISDEWATIYQTLIDLEGKAQISDVSAWNPDKTLDLVQHLSGIRIGRQTTATVGMRVGRPEKAMLRHMKPPVHVLFPVGMAGGNTRDLVAAAKKGTIRVDMVNITCPSCGKRKLSSRCEDCGEATIRFLSCPRCGQTINTEESQECPQCKVEGVTHSNHNFDMKTSIETVLRKVPEVAHSPIKGVRGLSNGSRYAEPMAKGALRSKHGVYVYKDGTARIDITNAPLTHFRPSNIHADLPSMLSLGYELDKDGNPLVDPQQIVALKPQDVVIPENTARDLVRIAAFVDEELQMIYGLKPFYNVKTVDDLKGKVVVGLAPHTSVGVAGRIVGFSNSQVCFANPCWQSAKRRDCDGDGDSVLLLLDIFLNFSVEYIPTQIGGLMDTPLLIQPIILPAEVDDQSHNFDVAWKYPLSFYEAAESSPNASKLSDVIDTIRKRINLQDQFYNYGFTHDTSSISIRAPRSAYSTLSTLNEKIAKQIEVAEKIEAVSAKQVVESIIKTHLIRDIAGNMKKYATQSFKCRTCSRSLRRPTVSGRCDICGGEIRETLTKGSVQKYLTIARKLAHEYDVDEYIRERLDLLVREMDQLFQSRDKTTQLELGDFAVEEEPTTTFLLD